MTRTRTLVSLAAVALLLTGRVSHVARPGG